MSDGSHGSSSGGRCGARLVGRHYPNRLFRGIAGVYNGCTGSGVRDHLSARASGPSSSAVMTLARLGFGRWAYRHRNSAGLAGQHRPGVGSPRSQHGGVGALLLLTCQHEHRGVGLSSRNVSLPNLETRVADLLCVLDAVGTNRVVLGGCSRRGDERIITRKPPLTWSGRRDSNPRPPPWQGGALPTEPRPRANHPRSVLRGLQPPVRGSPSTQTRPLLGGSRAAHPPRRERRPAPR